MLAEIFDVDRAQCLAQLALARGDEGFLLALGYSTQRGYGGTHPFAGEIRMGEVTVEIEPPELGFAIDIGDIVITECQMVNQFKGSKAAPPQFTRGYGLVFGHSERKAIAMALSDAGPVQVPAAGARGQQRTLFLLDRGAASQLPPQLNRIASP